ncbi:hypothetical protein [Blastopirellula marina]|uniref:Uncharacterized protein n=1 Tax=Blastopirellula marina TaxID=124 RepID=A0A2S8G0K5_9BACT|nr:hypothetical protein [Blastopirellula marina]PQO37966.1 hypothetical protein C5Y98_07685 [Blastopirellula marina]PTL44622.1 hypothetical protein C5Y97_07685 [Blastopirellula marina]
MQSYAITAEHWQAALEVPKQIALDLAAPLNLRLQAVRMVQAMLKVILSDAKDREKANASSQSPKKSGALPPSAWVSESQSGIAKQLPSQRHADKDGALAEVAWIPSTRETQAHEDANLAPVQANIAEETVATERTVDLPAATPLEQSRTGYIGRVGPRKVPQKRKSRR